MVQNKYQPCNECIKEGNINNMPIVNQKHKLCPRHNRIRLDVQQGRIKIPQKTIKQNRFSTSFRYDTQWGFNKEMDMYVAIWLDRTHISWLTGRPVQFKPFTFLHILAKGLNKYPHFRFNPNNIILGTWEEHNLIDNGDQDKIEAYKKKYPNFEIEAFNRKKEELIELYSEMYGQ